MTIREMQNEILHRLPFDGSSGKESACNAGDTGSIPGLRGSLEGGNGNPLQYSCLENPTGLVGYSQRVKESRTQLEHAHAHAPHAPEWVKGMNNTRYFVRMWKN